MGVTFFDDILGQEMPGGCDDCNAFTVVERGDTGIYQQTVHHDATCPFLTQWKKDAGGERKARRKSRGLRKALGLAPLEQLEDRE